MTPRSEYVEIVRLLAPALWTAAAVGVGASWVGTFVLLRRQALAALALPQVVAVGAAAGLRLGWPTLGPALAAVVLAVLLLAWSRRRGADPWALPALYIAGLSLSFLLIASSGEHLAYLQNLFTGIEVAVAPTAAWLAAPTVLTAGTIAALLWRRWLLLAQTPTAAEAAGLRPARWDALFLSLLAVVLLVSTDTLGAVMAVAMLFLPPAIVAPWVKRLPGALLSAAVVALTLLAAGLVLSVEMDWPLSQSVGGAGFAILCVSHLAARYNGGR